MDAAKIQIVEGDCLEALAVLPAESAQAIIADPPYYNVVEAAWDRQWEAGAGYLEWTKRWVHEAMRVLHPQGLFFCFGQLGKREHVFLHMMSELSRLFQFHDLITWDRAVGYNERRDSFTPATELILVLRKSETVKFNKEAVREPYDAETIQMYLRDKRYKDREARLAHLGKGKFATNIWRIPSLKGVSKEKCGHPTQKPLRVIERLVLCSTDPGDLVVDPFSGSGTTAAICQRLDRRCVGIEKDPGYCEMARLRLAETADQLI